MIKDIKTFMVDYYENIDFSYWNSRLNDTEKKLDPLTSWDQKSHYYIDLYIIYLQLLEIFCVNLLILSSRERGFLNFLFSRETNSHIRKYFNKPEYLDWILENLIFGVVDKQQISNYEAKHSNYKEILTEVVGDYLEDINLLNSYKHGFRVHTKELKSISINGNTVMEFDVQFIYYDRGKDKVIYENTIGIKHERTIIKCHFLLSMLENAKKVFLSQEKNMKEQINIDSLSVLDFKKWSESYGSIRTKEPLFYPKM